jgi:hypothetical protein
MLLNHKLAVMLAAMLDAECPTIGVVHHHPISGLLGDGCSDGLAAIR